MRTKTVELKKLRNISEKSVIENFIWTSARILLFFLLYAICSINITQNWIEQKTPRWYRGAKSGLTTNCSTSFSILYIYERTLRRVHLPVRSTWCDNLIPGMAMWKQSLLTCALTVAVAFEILSLWSYALRETMVPLPETVECRFPEYLAVMFSRCDGCQKGQQICVSSGHFLILKRTKKLLVAKSGE